MLQLSISLSVHVKRMLVIPDHLQADDDHLFDLSDYHVINRTFFFKSSLRDSNMSHMLRHNFLLTKWLKTPLLVGELLRY